jgi:hypothetical protein
MELVEEFIAAYFLTANAAPELFENLYACCLVDARCHSIRFDFLI